VMRARDDPGSHHSGAFYQTPPIEPNRLNPLNLGWSRGCGSIPACAPSRSRWPSPRA
jgi:hypothetical protein